MTVAEREQLFFVLFFFCSSCLHPLSMSVAVFAGVSPRVEVGGFSPPRCLHDTNRMCLKSVESGCPVGALRL